MSITVKDCLKLPSLRLGKVVAGHSGLDSIVTTVSVIEFEDLDHFDDIITPNELLISALFFVKDDVDAQMRLLRRYKDSGDVGLVLFYASSVLGNPDSRLLELADRIHFPLILMPEQDMGLKYSDVINDVMEAVIFDRRASNSFVSSTIERLSQTPEDQRTPSLVLRIAGDYAKASFFLCDRSYNIIASSCWPANHYADHAAVKDFFGRDPGGNSLCSLKNADMSYFRLPFTERNNNHLMLCAVSHNEILSSAQMREVVEVIQLFTALWNYNLNVSTKESVIPALLDDNRLLADYICCLTGIDKTQYRDAAVAELSKTRKKGAEPLILNRIRSFFSKNEIPCIADRIGSHIVMLYHNKTDPLGSLFREDLQALLSHMEEIDYYICWQTDGLFEKLSSFFKEYKQGNEALKRIYPHKRSFTPEDLHYGNRVFELLRSSLEDQRYYTDLLRPVLEDDEASLIETLCCYLLDADSGLKKTSELLFVHKNTALYRLNKVRRLLGCDLLHMPMAYDIYMAVSLYRLDQEKPAVP